VKSARRGDFAEQILKSGAGKFENVQKEMERTFKDFTQEELRDYSMGIWATSRLNQVLKRESDIAE